MSNVDQVVCLESVGRHTFGISANELCRDPSKTTSPFPPLLAQGQNGILCMVTSCFALRHKLVAFVLAIG